LLAAIFVGLLLSGPLLAADEIDQLLERLRLPARLADHVPRFSATEEEFTFRSNAGPIKRRVWVIRDGSRYVAVWHPLASKLYVVAPDPGRASDSIQMPPTYNDGGNTFDGKLGTRVTTFPYCHGFIQKADEHRFGSRSRRQRAPDEKGGAG